MKRAPRLAAIMLTVSIIIATLPPPASSASSAHFEFTLRLGLLAVKEANSRLAGEVIPAELTVSWPGNGSVRIYSGGEIGNSTLYSAIVGFMVASLLAGYNPKTLDFKVNIDTSERVSGPSASGLLASAALLALAGGVVEPNSTMTGMVSLTGFILPVSGVGLKVKAAERKGYHLILVPMANVDEALASSTSSKVLGVCSVEQAALLLGGRNFTLAPLKVDYERLRVLVNGMAERFVRYSKLFREASLKLSKLLGNETIERTVLQLVNLSSELDSRDPYASASLAFMAAYIASEYAARLKGLNVVEEAFNTTLTESLAAARKAISERESLFVNRTVCGAWGLEALEAAKLRLYFAERLLNSGSNTSKAIALIRAISAASWAELANPTWGPLVPCENVKRMSSLLRSYALASYKYMESIVGRYVNITRMSYGGTLPAWIEDMEKAYENGDYYLASALATYIVGDLDSRLVDSSGVPVNCTLSRLGLLLALSTARGLPSLQALLTELYIRDAGEALANIAGSMLVVSDLAVSGIAWALQSLALASSNMGSGGGGITGGTVSSSSAAQLYCMMVIAIVAVVLAVASYIGYRLSTRLYLESLGVRSA